MILGVRIPRRTFTKMFNKKLYVSRYRHLLTSSDKEKGKFHQPNDVLPVLGDLGPKTVPGSRKAAREGK